VQNRIYLIDSWHFPSRAFKKIVEERWGEMPKMSWDVEAEPPLAEDTSFKTVVIWDLQDQVSPVFQNIGRNVSDNFGRINQMFKYVEQGDNMILFLWQEHKGVSREKIFFFVQFDIKAVI